MTICCSLVPEKEPRIACVIEDGGLIVNEYMNMEEVVAMMGDWCPWAGVRGWTSFRGCLDVEEELTQAHLLRQSRA